MKIPPCTSHWLPLSLIVTLIGCATPGGAQAPNASRGLKEAGVFEADAAHLSLQVWCLEGDRKRLVQEGERLRTGDRLEIEVRSDADIYLYLLQFFPDGGVSVLADGQPIRAGEGGRLPLSGGYYQLDTFTGVEHLYFLASRAPLSEVDQAAAGLIAEIRTSPTGLNASQKGAGVVEPASEPPEASPKTQAPKASPGKSAGGASPQGALSPQAVAGASYVQPNGESVAVASLLTTRGIVVTPPETEASAYVQTDDAGVAVVHYWVEHGE